MRGIFSGIFVIFSISLCGQSEADTRYFTPKTSGDEVLACACITSDSGCPSGEFAQFAGQPRREWKQTIHLRKSAPVNLSLGCWTQRDTEKLGDKQCCSLSPESNASRSINFYDGELPGAEASVQSNSATDNTDAGPPSKPGFAVAIKLQPDGSALQRLLSDRSVNSGYFLDSNDKGILTLDYPRDGVFIGQGWDSFLNRKTPGFCVDGVGLEQSEDASTNISFYRVNDREQIFDALSIDASASYSGYRVSASGRVSYAKSVKIDTQSLNILAKVHADRGVTVFVPGTTPKTGELRLTSDALSLLPSAGAKSAGSNSDPAAFRLRCGDAFVIGIRKGGELDALLQFSAKANETKETLAASFEAKGYGASVSAAMEHRHDTTAEHRDFEYQWFETGQSISAKNPLDVDAFVDRFSLFGTDPKTFTAAPYEIYVLSYSQLETALQSQVTVASNSFMERLASHYHRLVDLGSAYNDVILHPGEYYVKNTSADGKDPWTNIYSNQATIYLSAQLLDDAIASCFSTRKCASDDVYTAINSQIAASEAGATMVPAVLGSSLVWGHSFKPGSVSDALGTTISDAVREVVKKQWTDENTMFAVSDGTGPNPGVEPPAAPLRDYEAYYFWLASLPVGQKELPNLWLLNFDSQKTVLPGVAANAAAPTDAELVAHATPAMREWLLRNRLVPLSDAYCKKAAQHPLCVPPSRLREIIAAVDFYFDAADVKPPAPIVTPAPPKAAPAPRPAREPPCHRMRGIMSDCNGPV